MANPFYIETGFTKTEIGLVSKSYGVAMTIVGGLLGGLLVAKMGIMRSLLVCGILQALSNLVFVAQAMVGPDVRFLMVTISVENLTGGMGTAAFVAYLSSLCNLAYTATQYALVSSFMAFARTFFASAGGWVADNVDWVTYFLISTAAAVPGLLLLLWMMHLFPRKNDQVMVSALADDD
jgi:PAT family beta-lactamase induction signal transducer AmpG